MNSKLLDFFECSYLPWCLEHVFCISGSFYQPSDGTGQLDVLDRDIEYAKVHTQVCKLQYVPWDLKAYTKICVPICLYDIQKNLIQICWFQYQQPYRTNQLALPSANSAKTSSFQNPSPVQTGRDKKGQIKTAYNIKPLPVSTNMNNNTRQVFQ